MAGPLGKAVDAGGITSGFSTNLPLIIIEAQRTADGQVPEIPSAHFAQITTYDNADGNTLHDDMPATIHQVEMQTITPSGTQGDAKADYYFMLKSEEKNLSRPALLEQEAGTEWLLLGSMHDKSLLRNYLAYTTAAAFMADIPTVAFCEVLLKDGAQYQYQGVYLLVESKNQMAKMYTPDTKAWSYGDPIVVKREPTPSEDTETLPTTASSQQYPSGYHTLPYPPGEISAVTAQVISGDINTLERVLYTDASYEFSTYTNSLDLDSFVAYFLLQEFFGNYDAATTSLYTYRAQGKHFSATPLGNFQYALDNQAEAPMYPWRMQMTEAPWYQRLAKSSVFVEKTTALYREMREDALSERRLNDLIDDAVLYLGDAQERDWARWGSAYRAYGTTLQASATPVVNLVEAKLLPETRATETYEAEIIKLKFLLKAHGDYIYQAIPALGEEHDIIRPADDHVSNSWLILGYFLLFGLTIRFVRIRTR